MFARPPLAPCCLGALVSVVFGCTNSFAISDGGVEVVRESSTFVIRNKSSRLDATRVLVELETSYVIDLAPCESWTPRLAPESEEVVPFADVMGYHEDADTVVVHWCLLDGDEAVDGGGVRLSFD